jgi:hypothetical protein
VGVSWLEQCPNTRSEGNASGAVPGGSGRCVLAALWVAVLGVDVEGTGDEFLDGAVGVVPVEVLDPGQQLRAHVRR